MQFTPPVQILYALRQAVNEYFLETEDGRANRYAHMYQVLTAGLKKLGFRFLIEEKSHAKILTAIIEPSDQNYDFNQMHDFLYQRGFTVYPGKGAKKDTFRLANMCDQGLFLFLVDILYTRLLLAYIDRQYQRRSWFLLPNFINLH